MAKGAESDTIDIRERIILGRIIVYMFPIMLRRVRGHSMMPVLPPKTLVWGMRWFNRLKAGQIIIFVHDDKERIRRIDKIDSDKLFLVGDSEGTDKDSRQFGWVQLDQVKAKVIWPRAPKS